MDTIILLEFRKKKRETSVKNIFKKSEAKSFFLVTKLNEMLWKLLVEKPALRSNTVKRKHMWFLWLKMVLISST